MSTMLWVEFTVCDPLNLPSFLDLNKRNSHFEWHSRDLYTHDTHVCVWQYVHLLPWLLSRSCFQVTPFMSEWMKLGLWSTFNTHSCLNYLWYKKLCRGIRYSNKLEMNVKTQKKKVSEDHICFIFILLWCRRASINALADVFLCVWTEKLWPCVYQNVFSVLTGRRQRSLLIYFIKRENAM